MVRTIEKQNKMVAILIFDFGKLHQNLWYFNVLGIPKIDIQAPLYFMKLCRLAKTPIIIKTLLNIEIETPELDSVFSDFRFVVSYYFTLG